MNIRTLFLLLILSVVAIPLAYAQTAAEPADKSEPQKRRITYLDPEVLNLANEIDMLRAKMAAEDQRHYEELTILRDQLKIASEKMIAYRKQARDKKRKDAPEAQDE